MKRIIQKDETVKINGGWTNQGDIILAEDPKDPKRIYLLRHENSGYIFRNIYNSEATIVPPTFWPERAIDAALRHGYCVLEFENVNEMIEYVNRKKSV